MKIGPAFSDYIKLEKGQKHPSYSFGKTYKIRDYLLPLILVIAVCVIGFRLFSLQVLKGSYYRSLSDSNRIRNQVIHAPRGIIFDTNGVPLVFNKPGFRQEVSGKTILLDTNKALTLIAKGSKNLEVDSLRSYPYDEVFSHVLGYVGQISKEELKYSKYKNYQGGDLIGKMGVEEEYEAVLRGQDGKELVEVNSLGEEIRKLGKKDPIPGRNITLTLDLELQKAAFLAMKDVKKGAVIVSNPKGEILALVSKPFFDPNLFTMGEGYKSLEETTLSSLLLDTENQPFLNRAISGTYPPGSTFKLITASAGLEDKIINKDFTVEDTGVINLGAFSFSNWYFTQYGKKDGEVNVVKAIKRSNDIFFYKLAEKVGVNKLSQFAEKFGLGKKLGIDIPGEQNGTVPTPQWKKSTIGENWYLGDTYHYGIGQGFLLTTPLQVNAWTQIIANEGIIYKPHLLKNTTNTTNTTNKPISKKFLSDETVSLIKEGMIESCSPGGVAWPLFKFKVDREISIACKTGTAQHGGEDTLPHAWITLFAPAASDSAPAEKPQIIITVLSESSGEGSNVAAPIAKKILEEWFGR